MQQLYQLSFVLIWGTVKIFRRQFCAKYQSVLQESIIKELGLEKNLNSSELGLVYWAKDWWEIRNNRQKNQKQYI